MKVTIIGGGNIGTLMAAEMAAKGHEVTVYTSKPEQWNREIEVYDPGDHRILTGELYKITSDMQEAVCDAVMVWIVTPAQTFKEMAEKLLPYIKSGQYIGVVPGSGGAEFAFRHLIDAGCVLFGLQRVHSIARLKEYGKSVYMLGRKSRLELGAIPSDAGEKIAPVLEKMFDMPCSLLPNYLSVTLTPSNPILHTTRLYSMFKDYGKDVVYPRNFLFYEEWDVESAEWLIACDGELQALCEEIPLELKEVKSLWEYYESYDARAMAEKLKSIKAFKGLTSPMKQTEGGWIPDFESRYFVADFSYGLKIIKDIAELFGVAAPHIDTVWKWFTGVAILPEEKVFGLEICDKDEFVRLYE